MISLNYPFFLTSNIRNDLILIYHITICCYKTTFYLIKIDASAW